MEKVLLTWGLIFSVKRSKVIEQYRGERLVYFPAHLSISSDHLFDYNDNKITVAGQGKICLILSLKSHKSLN